MTRPASCGARAHPGRAARGPPPCARSGEAARRRYCPRGRRGQWFRQLVGRSRRAGAAGTDAARVHSRRPPRPARRRGGVAAARRGTAPRRAPAHGAGHGRRAPPAPHRAAPRPGAARPGRRPARRRDRGGHRRRVAGHHVPQRGAGGPQRARPAAGRCRPPSPRRSPSTLLLDPEAVCERARRHPPRSCGSLGAPPRRPRTTRAHWARRPGWGWVGLQPEITTTALLLRPTTLSVRGRRRYLCRLAAHRAHPPAAAAPRPATADVAVTDAPAIVLHLGTDEWREQVPTRRLTALLTRLQRFTGS